MVEDYVPDRVEFDLTSKAKSISPAAPAQVTWTGVFSTARRPPISNCPAR